MRKFELKNYILGMGTRLGPSQKNLNSIRKNNEQGLD